MEVYYKYSWLLARKMKDNYSDILTPLKKGKEWLYELTLKHQPKTAEIFLNSPLGICEYRKKFILLSQIDLQLIEIQRETKGYNLSDENYKIREYLYPKMKQLIKEDSRFFVFKNTNSRPHSLPMEIREAYYTRFDGFKYVMPKLLSSIHSCLYPANSSEWNSIDGYLDSIGKKKELLPWIEEYFPGKMTRHPNMLEKDSPYTNLMVFLDSRCSYFPENNDSHFVLLVKTSIQDEIIYVIQDGDVKNMRILSNYKEAMDDYCSLMLLAKGKEFDITKYTSDFIDPRTQHDKEVYENTQEEIDWWRNR